MIIISIILFIIFAIFFLGSITENCATYAIRKWLFQGGCLVVRRSFFADDLIPEGHSRRKGVAYKIAKMVPHFVWIAPNGKVWQYTVKEAWKGNFKMGSLASAWLKLWFYDGVESDHDPILGYTYDPALGKPKGVWAIWCKEPAKGYDAT